MNGVVLRCAGCGAVPDLGRGAWPWACPQRRDGDDVDHLIVPQVEPTPVRSDSDNPFVRYRGRLASYHLWRDAGRDDQSFVALVENLDAAIAHVEGDGFRVTPLTLFPRLDDAVGAATGLQGRPGPRVWVKDETGNVAGSHKARHLFGVLLLLGVLDEIGSAVGGDLVIASCGNAAQAAAVLDERGPAVGGDLVIASCGNAAQAAAVLAAAVGRHLSAFVPADADPAMVERLAGLGVSVERCVRDGRPGDPCYQAFREAVADGAIPFSCQGPDNGFAIEGATTLMWEAAEALPGGVDRVVIQVGGGALATACVRGLDALRSQPVFDTVQTAGAYPLHRALTRLQEGIAGGLSVSDVLASAARHRSRYMWPWEAEPVSVARGILDDETYDWLAVSGAMLRSGGKALVADEAVLEEANQLARAATGIDVDVTGSAGLAGLLMLARGGGVPPGSDVLVVFTGGGAG